MIEKEKVSFPNEKDGWEDVWKDVWNSVVIDEKFLRHFGIKCFENISCFGKKSNFIKFLDNGYFVSEIVPILKKENIIIDIMLDDSLILNEENCDKLFEIFIDNYKVSNELEDLKVILKSKDTKDALENIKNIRAFILSKEEQTSKLEDMLEDVKSNNKTLSEMLETVKDLKKNKEKVIEDKLLSEINDLNHQKDNIVARVITSIRNGGVPHEGDIKYIYAFESCISILNSIEIPFETENRILLEIDKITEQRTEIESRVISSIRNGKEPHKADLNTIYVLDGVISKLEKILK